MKLYYCETINPRKACAAARYLNSSLEFVRIDLSRGEHRSGEFPALNPNGKVPVLKDGDWSLWEANAIMCHLSDVARADLWPHDARQIEVMRWLSWDAQQFTRHGGTLYFEHLIKPQLGLGDADPAVTNQATAKLPLAGYPAIQNWYAHLENLPAWRDDARRGRGIRARTSRPRRGLASCGLPAMRPPP